MNKRLGALDAAFSQLDVDPKKSADKREKVDVPKVLRQRNSLADEVAGGRVKSASQRLVLPSQCRMWRRHNRIYELLSPDNCRELIDDIRGKETQHTPAIARPIKDDSDGIEYEIIAGARRHFAVNYLREKEGMTNLLYLIEVKRMSDAEAFLVADAENRGRKDISDYERAIDYASALEEYYDGNTQKMADKVGMARTTLRHYLNLAKLPNEIVEAFYVPTDIALRSASKLAPILNDERKHGVVLKKAREIAVAQQRAKELGQAKAYEGSQVMRDLLAASAEPQKRGASRKAVQSIQSDSGSRLFELERGRKFMTIRIPLGQLDNSTELMKKLKREIAKSK